MILKSVESPWPNADDRRPDRRRWDARLLHAARDAFMRGRAEHVIDHALDALPESRHARRYKIERLLEQNAVGRALALTTEGLLLFPSDPTLSRLQAERLLEARRPHDAKRELRPALRARPDHRATVMLAARIDRALGDHPGAVKRLTRLASRRPGDLIVRELLVGILIEAGSLERARRLMIAFGVTSPLLTAQLLAAEGDERTAIDVLEAAHRAAPVLDERLTCALIDLLERSHDVERLRGVLRRVGSTTPRALVRAGEARLRLGEHAAVLRDLMPIQHHNRQGTDALAVLAVAAAMIGRPTLLERCLHHIRRRRGGIDAARMAELWRRALTAAAVEPTRRPPIEIKSGAVLPGLLASAVETLDQAWARVPERSDVTSERARELARHRASLAALG